MTRAVSEAEWKRYGPGKAHLSEAERKREIETQLKLAEADLKFSLVNPHNDLGLRMAGTRIAIAKRLTR